MMVDQNLWTEEAAPIPKEVWDNLETGENKMSNLKVEYHSEAVGEKATVMSPEGDDETEFDKLNKFAAGFQKYWIMGTRHQRALATAFYYAHGVRLW